MKYLKIFEDFERGGRYPLPEKQCRYVRDNYPWINDPTYINADGSSYFLGDDVYDTLDDAINNMLNHFNISKCVIEGNKVNYIERKYYDYKIDISNRELKKIPFNFGIVECNFLCQFNKLETLEGAPQIVYGHFSCSDNNLTCLKYCPENISGDFNCSYNKLTTLEYGPKDFKEKDGSYSRLSLHYNCSHNQLESLYGLPDYFYRETNFNCSNNKLTSLKYSPKGIYKNYNCSDNKLTSLAYGPNEVSHVFTVSNNLLNNDAFINFHCKCQIMTTHGNPST